jgi:hypothetical protein
MIDVSESASVADIMAWRALTNDERACFIRVLRMEVGVSDATLGDIEHRCYITDDVARDIYARYRN